MSEQLKPFLITIPTLTTIEIMAKDNESALLKARGIDYNAVNKNPVVQCDVDFDRLEERYETEQDFDLTDEDMSIPEDLQFSDERHMRFVRALLRADIPSEEDRNEVDNCNEYIMKYSGRGMYGKYVPGIVSKNVGKTFAKLGEALKIVGSLSIDTLGYDSVIYPR